MVLSVTSLLLKDLTKTGKSLCNASNENESLAGVEILEGRVSKLNVPTLTEVM